MESLKLSFFISVLLLFTVRSFSQIVNAEILDHSDHRTILTSFGENNGDLVYVVENNRRGYSLTQVKVSQNGGQPVDVLSEELRFRSNSKWFYDSNDNVRIFLYGLTNSGFDDFSADFIEIKEENNIYTSRQIDNTFMNSLEVIVDVALDSLDNVYTLTSYPRLQIFENETLQSEVNLNIGSQSILHSSEIGEVYLIDSSLDSIFKVNDLNIEFVNTLTLDIKEVKNIGGSIWVLTNDDNLYQYASNFSGLPIEIPVSFNINSLDQVSESDAGIYFLESLTDGFRIHVYDSGVFTMIHERMEDYASSTKLHAVNDSVFVTAGQFEVQDIANHAFLRGYNLNQAFNPERRNVYIDDFELTYNKDTMISGAPDDLWLYDVNYAIRNMGDANTSYTSIYTSHLVPQFTSGHFLFDHQVFDLITPNDTRSIDTSRLIPFYHPSVATVSVTGCDYKFNESFEPMQIDITTSTLDFDPTKNSKIYPNPFTSYLNIETESVQDFYLYNSGGVLVFKGQIDRFQREDFSELDPGNYFLRLSDTEEMFKIIKLDK